MPTTDMQIDPDEDVRRLRRAFFGVAAFVGLLWLLQLFELILGLQLHAFTNFPRQMNGLLGVLFAPLLHGSIGHLFANTLPVLVLGTALFYGYPKAARIVLPVVWLGSGIAVWLFARPAFHLGASGLTFGMLFFLFTIGALRWDPRAIALSLAVFFLYGGMIWGIFPTKPNISFEYHLAGAVLGITLAVLLKNLDPRPPKKTYDWEGEGVADDGWPDDGPWPEDERTEGTQSPGEELGNAMKKTETARKPAAPRFGNGTLHWSHRSTVRQSLASAYLSRMRSVASSMASMRRSSAWRELKD